MKAWFYENFEDPIEHTSYDAEDGYIYIGTGPCEAEDELTFFSEYASNDVIDELAKELSLKCLEWASKDKFGHYEDDYLDLILSDNEYYKSFNDSINHVKEILKIKITKNTKIYLLGLLHVSVITAIETYLSDAFINTVIHNKEKMRRFVENNIEFKKQKFSLSDVYKTHENIETEVKKYLLSLMWHNLGKIKPIYKSTLNIDFPEKDIITSIFQAIKIRHDLVHRNGKSTSGEEILITKEGIKKLIDDSSSFVNHINNQLDSIKEDKSIYLDMDDCPF